MAEGPRRLALLPDAAARPVQDRQLRQGPRAGHPDHRGGRGGQPPPRRRADLPAGRRRPAQPRRRRRHQPRRRAGPADLRDRRRARRRVGAARGLHARARARRARRRRGASRSGRRCSATTDAPCDTEILDPGGRNNTLWFQEAPEATGEVQQRFHLDIVVPREVAEERVAGGARRRRHPGQRATTVPAFWVLADAHGNKVCVCTADGREAPPSEPRRVRPASRMLGRLAHSDDGRAGERLPWCHAQGPSCTHATCGLSPRPTRARTSPLVAQPGRGVFCWARHGRRSQETRRGHSDERADDRRPEPDQVAGGRGHHRHLRHPRRRHPAGVRPPHGLLDPAHPGPPRAGRRPRRAGVRRGDRPGRRLHGDLRPGRDQPGHADRRRAHGLRPDGRRSPARSAPRRSAPTPSRRPTSAASRCRSPSTTSWSPTPPRSRARIAEAFHIASTGRPGPVLVDIAKSALQAMTTYAWPTELQPARLPPGDPAALQADPRGRPADPRVAAPGAVRRRRHHPRRRLRGAARCSPS